MVGQPRGSARLGTCRGCGRPVRWAFIDGKNVPLDPIAPIYMRIYSPDTQEHFWVRDERLDDEPLALVSHFATCPEANRFSRNRRPGEEAR